MRNGLSRLVQLLYLLGNCEMHFPGILQRQNGLFQRSQLVVVLKKEPEGLLERIDGLFVHLEDAKDAALLLLVLIEDIRNPVFDRVFGFLLV